MAKAKILTYPEFIDYALAHYNKGGDTFYECWDLRTFQSYVEQFGAITKSKALKMFREQKAIDDEYRAAARWFSGEDW